MYVQVPQVFTNLIFSYSGRDFAPGLVLYLLKRCGKTGCQTEAKELLRTLATFLSVVTILPVVSIRRDMLSWSFLYWLLYLEKPFLLFFVSHPTFSCRHVSAFLTPSLPNQAVSLDPSQCPCCHCLSSSLLPFSLASRSQFSHVSLLPSTPDFLHFRIKSSYALWRTPLKICPFVPEGCFPRGPINLTS